MNRLTRSITLVLIGSPLVLLSCGPQDTSGTGRSGSGGHSTYFPHSGGYYGGSGAGTVGSGGGHAVSGGSVRGGFGSSGHAAS